jgi:inner membrane protease subunit 1
VALHTLKFIAFAHLIWEYGISMSPASGPSMLPTFEVLGEWLLVSKLHRFGRGITVGDVVAYNIPINEEVGVTRVLGLPGDYVLMDTPGEGGGVMGMGMGMGTGGGGGNMIQVSASSISSPTPEGEDVR